MAVRGPFAHGAGRDVTGRRDVIANYLGSAWVALVNIAFVPLYVRYLGVEAYGLIGLFASFQTWLTLLDGGLTPTLSRELALAESGVRAPQSVRDLVVTAEMTFAAIIALIATSFLFLAPWLVDHWIRTKDLGPREVVHAFQAMGFLLGIRWLASLYRGAYVGLQRQVWFNSWSSVFATLRGVGTIAALAYLSRSVVTFFIVQSIISAVESLFLAISVRRFLPHAQRSGRFRIESVAGVWRFAAGMTILALLGLLLTQVDKLLLSKLLPLSAFGSYMVANSIAAGLYLLVAPITNVSYPRFVSQVASCDQRRLAEIYHRFAQATAVMVMPAGIVLALFANRALTLWTGSAEIGQKAAIFVSLLALGNMLHGLMHTSYTLQLAYGWTRFNIIVNAVAVVLLLPALYFGIRTYGAVAAAFLWAVLNLAYVVIATPLVHRQLLRSEMVRWYRQSVLLPGVCAGAAASAVWILTRSEPLRVTQNVTILCIALACAFLAAAFATPLGRKEIRSHCKLGRTLVARLR